MSRWWRAYDDALHDPKLIALSDRLHRAWFNLLCVASKNGGLLPAMSVVAIELRVTIHKAAEYVTALVIAGLIDEIETGKFAPHNWATRQFQSDVSTERVKRFRQHRRNVSSTVSETPPETEAEAETDPSLRSGARRRAMRLEKDWWPTPENIEYALAKGLSLDRVNVEAEKFRNYWTAKAGKDAAKLDWDATWQNWILKALETPNGHARPQRKTLGERGHELANEARALERAAGAGHPDDPLGGH